MHASFMIQEGSSYKMYLGFVIDVLTFVTSLHVTRGGCNVFFSLSLGADLKGRFSLKCTTLGQYSRKFV